MAARYGWPPDVVDRLSQRDMRMFLNQADADKRRGEDG